MARFDHQEKMQGIALLLGLNGYKVISRWIDSENDANDEDRWAEYARRDLEDIANADIGIAFTETDDVGYTRGGRHCEAGVFANSEFKELWVVGSIENVFYALADRHFENEEQLLQFVGGSPSNSTR